MKENETKALELSEEELTQVSGGGFCRTANDGNCGQTVNLDGMGRCTDYHDTQCGVCKYFPGCAAML